MKQLTVTLAFLMIIAFSCQQHSKKEATNATALKDVQPVLKAKKSEKIQREPVRSSTNGIISSELKKLDSIFTSAPFYAVVDTQKIYVISDGEKKQYNPSPFAGTNKYGLASDSGVMMLPINYSKIYNPDATLQNCFEIKQEKKVGLFNYATQEVLAPQFDFILPADTMAQDFAYGYRLGQWYEIHSGFMNEFEEVAFDPNEILKVLSFSIPQLKDNLMYDTYATYSEEDANLGDGVVVIPSYLEYLNLISREQYTDVRAYGDRAFEFGTDEIAVKTKHHQSISDKVISFFVSVYEAGIDGRGYTLEKEQLVLYNSENKKLTTVPLTELHAWEYFCREASHTVINDSIIEIKSNQQEYELKHQRYNFETQYRYLHISPQGKVTPLDSDRYYDFTKYIFINEEHLTGCFATYMAEGADGYNIWQSDHLTIEDLDVMRNEIYAEYGYRFTSKKWNDYFTQKKWYRPRYSNVNDQLTDLDRANIEVIFKVRKAMEGKEATFINRRKGTYVAAG